MSAKTNPCPRCSGTGHVLSDAAVGKLMRTIREASKVSGREVARRLGYSAPFVCDLELGRRGWTEDKQARYIAAVSAAAKAKR